MIIFVSLFFVPENVIFAAYMAPEVFTKTNTDGHGRAGEFYH